MSWDCLGCWDDLKCAGQGGLPWVVGVGWPGVTWDCLIWPALFWGGLVNPVMVWNDLGCRGVGGLARVVFSLPGLAMSGMEWLFLG